jgi:small redox-active disulfide protein 2
MNLSNLKPANMEIKVLGTGCAKCKALEKATREAVAQIGVNATITKVEDIVEIMKYNVMTTPALVVDGKIVVKGKVPSVDEIKKFLAQ